MQNVLMLIRITIFINKKVTFELMQTHTSISEFF